MSAKKARVVLITGASSGIGRASASLFARRGWRVGLVSRSEQNLEATRREVEQAGGTGCVGIADVADSTALARAADRIERQLGPIDVWVNNAGTSVYGRFLDITEDEFRRLTEVNYLGTVNGTRLALERMLPRNRGTIVQVASVISYRGVPLTSPYSGSKYAIRGFTEAIRAELFHDGSNVHVTMVHPPAVNTPFYNHAQSHMSRPVRPPPPIYQPEIVADAIYLAATTRRREVKVSGSAVAFTALNKVIPGVLDYFAGKFGEGVQQSSRQTGAVARRDPNLFHAPQGESATHGPFDDEAFGSSAQMWATKNRTAIGVGAGVIALLALAAVTQPAARHRH